MGAVFAAPAIPAQAFLTSSAPVADATVTIPNLYTWSKMIARKTGEASPEMIMKTLGVGKSEAAALCNRLIANGVVGQANALGLSQTNPIKTLKKAVDDLDIFETAKAPEETPSPDETSPVSEQSDQ